MEKENDVLIEILRKNADKTLGKVLIPKYFLKKHGYSFKMSVYNNKIVIEPSNDGVDIDIDGE